MAICFPKSALVAVGLCAALSFLSGCSIDSSEGSGDLGAESEEDALSGPRLLLVKEKKIASLLGAGTFEASGVQAEGSSLFIIFDNMTKIATISTDLSRGALSSGGSRTKSSNFEGITAGGFPGEFFVIEEAAGDSNRGLVRTFDVNGDELAVEKTDIKFDTSNKGFEGVALLEAGPGDELLLGLCEGNSCKDDASNRGNGRIKVLRHGLFDWTTEATIHIPAAADFKDYSDIAVLDQGDGMFKVAITSQESKRLWIGTLDAIFMSFIDEGAVFSFPSSGYCNVEGVTWLSETRLAMVSDKTKDGNACPLKEQMVHIFDIP
jgi:hypothetical protein